MYDCGEVCGTCTDIHKYGQARTHTHIHRLTRTNTNHYINTNMFLSFRIFFEDSQKYVSVCVLVLYILNDMYVCCFVCVYIYICFVFVCRLRVWDVGVCLHVCVCFVCMCDDWCMWVCMCVVSVKLVVGHVVYVCVLWYTCYVKYV